jgi:RNA polymerase sigma-70 factor (ECF subfamily)
MAAAIGRGDELAFREMYDRYHGRLLRLALMLARGNEMLARETVQSVFIIAAAKLRKVESEGHLWNWLALVARQQNAKLSAADRKPSLFPLTDLADSEQPPDSERELESALDRAMLALDAPERELIEWFYFDRLSHKEIAVRLNTTPKAVSSRLERARIRLRTAVRKPDINET